MSINRTIKIGISSLILVVLTTFPSSVSAQKRKDIKNAGISSKKEWNYSYTNDTERKYLESEYQYDKNGNMLIEKQYDENGNIITHKEYQYDSNGNETVQLTYNPKGQVIERIETKYYKEDLKLEKKVFGPNGKLKSKKIFEYKTF